MRKIISTMSILLMLSGCSDLNKDMSKAELLEDYNELWENIEQIYPFYEVAERKGLNYKELKEKYEALIDYNTTREEFEIIINELIMEFDYMGHFSMIDKDTWLYMNAVYQSHSGENSRIDYLIDILNNEKSLGHYGITQQEIDFYNIGDLKSDDLMKETLFLEIISKDVAYIKVNSFSDEKIDEEVDRIMSFYKEIQDIPNLIIDIQDNNGGASEYYQRAFISPNIENDLSIKNYYLINTQTSNNNYFNMLGLKIDTDINLESLPELNMADYHRSGDIYSEEYTISSLNNKIMYSGNIFILTSPKVYSASEEFVYVSKTSGFATIVGQTTGGDGVGVDPCIFSLTNSGILYSFSIANGLNQDGSSNEEHGTTPDISFDNVPNVDIKKECLKIIEARRNFN